MQRTWAGSDTMNRSGNTNHKGWGAGGWLLMLVVGTLLWLGTSLGSAQQIIPIDSGPTGPGGFIPLGFPILEFDDMGNLVEIWVPGIFLGPPPSPETFEGVLVYNVQTKMVTQFVPRSIFVPPGSEGSASALSRDGTVAVGCQDGGDASPYFHAVRFTQSGDFQDLGTLDPTANLPSSFATGLSSDGSVVVGFASLGQDNQHAFRWTEADGMVDLGSPYGPSGASRAYGISSDGTVIIGDMSEHPFGAAYHAFVWSADSGFQDLGIGSAYAVTPDGSVVVGQANYRTPFLWTQANGVQDLGTLPGYSSGLATSVSDDGSVVVGIAGYSNRDNPWLGYTVDATANRAFIWTATGGMQDLTQLLADSGLDMTGITLVSAVGVSADGQWVCGQMRTPENDPDNPEDTFSYLAQLPSP